MRLGQFLTEGIVPWEQPKSLAGQFLEKGRMLLIQEKFGEAIKAFNCCISTKSAIHLPWAHLLRCYAVSVAILCGDCSDKVTANYAMRIDYSFAKKLDPVLTETEFSGCEIVLTWLNDLVDLTKQLHIEINFQQLQHQAWTVYFTSLQLEKSDTEAGISAATQGLRLMPSNYLLFLLRGDCWITKGINENQPEFYTDAEKDFTVAINICLLLENNQERLVKAYYNRCQAYCVQGAIVEAIRDFTAGVDNDNIAFTTINNEFRLLILKLLMSGFDLLLEDNKADKVQQEKHRKIRYLRKRILFNLGKGELYLRRAAVYESLELWPYAALDYCIVDWLSKTGIYKSSLTAENITTKMLSIKNKMRNEKIEIVVVQNEDTSEAVYAELLAELEREEKARLRLIKKREKKRIQRQKKISSDLSKARHQKKKEEENIKPTGYSISLPAYVQESISVLKSSGVKWFYLVGGFVRDSFRKKRGLTSSMLATEDVDLVTDALDTEIEQAFPGAEKRHGVYMVSLQDNHKLEIYQSRTLREKNSLYEDALTRDFTINALYANEKGEVYDPLLRGFEDLEKSHLETILPESVLFKSNPICIFRAIHFHSFLKLSLPEKMESAIRDNLISLAELTQNPEQVGKVNAWFNKIFCKAGKMHVIENFKKLSELGIIVKLFPEFADAMEKNKNLQQWVNTELWNTRFMQYSSLNYVYALLVVCVVEQTQQSAEQIIQQNPLFHANFREKFPQILLHLAKRNWLIYSEKIKKAVNADSVLAPKVLNCSSAFFAANEEKSFTPSYVPTTSLLHQLFVK